MSLVVQSIEPLSHRDLGHFVQQLVFVTYFSVFIRQGRRVRLLHIIFRVASRCSPLDLFLLNRLLQGIFESSVIAKFISDYSWVDRLVEDASHSH